MRGLLKLTLVVGLALGLAGVAQAQRPGGGFGPGAVLLNPGVQKELKLTEDQVGKVKEALEKVRDNHKDDFAKLREMSGEERRKLMHSVGEESHKAISGVLDAKQMKRLRQIQWQVGGANPLGNPYVQKTLKLNDDQKSQIKTILEGRDKKMREVFQGGNREGAREKLQEIGKETQEKATAVLTDEQKKSWTEMKGEPFKFERRGRNRNR